MRPFSSTGLNLLTGRLAASLFACATTVALTGCQLELGSEAAPTATTEESQAAVASQSAAGAAALTTSVLSLDGTRVGRVASVTGGSKKGTVTRAANGAKYLSAVDYETSQLNVSADLHPRLGNWLTASFNPANRNQPAKDLQIDIVDVDQKLKSSLTLLHAKAVEAKFPALIVRDTGASLGDVVLKVDPETTRREDGGGQRVTPGAPPRVVDHFTFTLGNLGGEIQKIDSFTVKLPANDPPNLLVTMTRDSAGPWIAWANSFIVDHPAQPRLSGSIELRAGDTVVARINLSNVGIVRLSDTPTASRPSASTDSVTAEIFSESWTLDTP
jgi:hypothetical protein